MSVFRVIMMLIKAIWNYYHYQISEYHEILTNDHFKVLFLTQIGEKKVLLLSSGKTLWTFKINFKTYEKAGFGIKRQHYHWILSNFIMESLKENLIFYTMLLQLTKWDATGSNLTFLTLYNFQYWMFCPRKLHLMLTESYYPGNY